MFYLISQFFQDTHDLLLFFNCSKWSNAAFSESFIGGGNFNAPDQFIGRPDCTHPKIPAFICLTLVYPCVSKLSRAYNDVTPRFQYKIIYCDLSLGKLYVV